MTQSFRRLLIPRSVYEGMLCHALAEAPRECCGLLAGVVTGEGRGEVRLRYLLPNAADDDREYQAETRGLLSAWKDIRRQGWEVLAIYHSHPSSEPIPSRKDLARNFWGDAVLHLILSLAASPPEVRGWWLYENDYREADWQIVASEPEA